MTSKHLIFLVITLHNLNYLEAQTTTWIKSAYYDSASNLPPSTVNSAIFTHLYYAFASINSSTYNLTFSNDESTASSFTNTLKANNPSIVTLLSIGLAYNANYSVFTSMVSHPSYRNIFITSSIQTARLYGFGGLDLGWVWPNMSSDMENIGILLDEWRVAIDSEADKSHLPPLVLTMLIYRLPIVRTASFPIDSMRRNLDWANFVAFDYHLPLTENVTGNHAALHDPLSHVDTDSGIKAWVDKGFPGIMIVLGLPYHGYAWNVMNPNYNSIEVGESASGPAMTLDGSVSYKSIRSFILGYGYGVSSYYNSTYCVNYFNIKSIWVNFDDVEAIRTKVLYAKAKGLRGYFAYQLANDDNWKLSQTAYEVGEDHEAMKKKKRLLVKISVPIATGILVLILGFATYFVRCRMLKSNQRFGSSEIGTSTEMNEQYYQEQNAPNLRVFTFSEIKAATSNFSSENRLGEGGYGPVYKGILTRGQEIAVKRLSKTSNQGLKEFENEVKLTAKLQHVNLVRLLGYCTQNAEKMLVYEYMPNKSLDFYLFDCERRLQLNWEKRVDIIEGIAQGLLYLQEYSNFTIIHRDIKASNILLDERMKPKISDFGIARIFHKENTEEAKTSQIVGTYGYVPPEYVKRGVYSTKYDVYSFGVVLLQIISGKKHSLFYGSSEDLNLLEYAYQLWRSDNGLEFIDSTLDDTFSPCKILMCLKVGLLCVQESPMDRPTMLEVYSMLKNGSFDKIDSPKKPAFSIGEDRESGQDFCSVNNLTVSQILAR